MPTCYAAPSDRKEAGLANSPELNRSSIGDGLRRLLDQRTEQRIEGETQTAVLNHRGHRHVVRIANLSASGAMIAFTGELAEGDEILLQLLDHGAVPAQVRWVRDGRVGVVFAGSADPPTDG